MPKVKKEVVIHRFYANGQNMFVAEWFKPFDNAELLKKAEQAKEMGYGEAEYVVDTTGRMVTLKDIKS